MNDKNILNVKIVAASSSINGVTGGAALYQYSNTTDTQWKCAKEFIPQAYKTDRALLMALIQAIEVTTLNPEAEAYNGALKIECFVYTDTILRGFNKQREVWEANGFINRQGNKVKEKALWQKLYKLSDQYDITIRKPSGYLPALKGCATKARNVALNGIQYEEDSAVMVRVAEAVARDKT